MTEKINKTSDAATVVPPNGTEAPALEGVAIIGMAGQFPGAPDVETFWQNVIAGKDTVSHFSPSEVEARNISGREMSSDYVASRGVLEDADMFDSDFFGIAPREADRMDPQHRLFLEACWNALEDAGYDPAAYAGQIGLFGGCSLNTYLLANLCHDRAFIDELTGNYQVGEFQAALGNDKDFLTTRAAYKLNLRGPCVSVQSACATSLVAICQASQSLMNYQCDMALAGGVSATFPQKRGHMYLEGGMGSRDGVCRTFDAGATGTVFGHGVGVILLKRLEDAVADRDRIVAVIRGFAVNNDGAMKVGYMAPGVDGQAGVIAAAQAMAGVDVDTISYIEAHGTATPLGDPIEIAALTKAFRLSTNRNGFCAVGSAKANVGHLDSAAGVTGVIKTALSLNKALLPPLAHFDKPNPNIDFANSPFYVNRELSPWSSDGPRRAGVSAFGVGGVNAHAVLEQAPELTRPERSSRPAQLLCLSARSESALKASIKKLADHLHAHPEAELDDVAYTLAVGRRVFDHRAMFVCSSTEDAVTRLAAYTGSQAKRNLSTSRPEVAFLFPGQGSQFAGMGSTLYVTEPVYRRQIDECAKLLQPHLGLDIREIIFPGDFTTTEAAERLQQTQFTQPALFVTELALATLFQHLGIQPQAMAGHSIGEYVAAVLAGVMTRENALCLVGVRGRLMQELPHGGMVSVRLSEQELQPYLSAEISIAALNAPKLSVLAGPLDAIKQVEARLTSAEAGFRRLRTSHAFHSSMMNPMLEAFEAEVAKVALQPPSQPYVSSVTGTWIQKEQATSARFWAEQCRKPVRFGEALQTLMATPRVLLEVGPGSALSTLARQQPTSEEAVIVTSLPLRDEPPSPEVGSMLEALGGLWQAGVAPDWSKFYENEQRNRTSLPTYPFERKRHWVEPPAQTVGNAGLNPSINVIDEKTPLPSPEDSAAVIEPAGDLLMQERKIRLQPIIAEVFAELSGIETTSEEVDHQFLELGFDSLFLTQATQSLQRKFGVKLTLRQIMEQFSTIASLAEHLDSVLPADAFPAQAPVPAPVPAAMPTPVFSPSLAASNGGPAAGAPASAIERLLAEQLATMSKIFEQQVATLQAAAGVSPALLSAPAAPPTPVIPAAPVVAKPVVPEATEVKHGSYKPLQPHARQDVDDDQQRYINALIARYEERTPGSKRLTQNHRGHLADPRAVAGFRPQWKEMVYPLLVERAKGSKLWDVDGNEYIDIVNGYGCIMFGHSPQFVVDAIREQIDRGVAIGPQTPLAGEVAALICELTGNERVTFCNTGSEAVMAAIRVARTVTGRDKLVYFAGDYHGTFDEVLVRSTPRGSTPLAPGIPIANTGNVVVLEYGSDQALEYIRKHADEIAAVLIEPVQTRNPGLQPIAFVRTVREMTEQAGIALIIDEVVTGFRLAPGGVQEVFGVRADMATYGKVIGGGHPIGVLSGKAVFLDALDGGSWQYGDKSVPETGVTFFAGTFVRHPLALAAARSVLTYLKTEGPALQRELNRKTAELATSLDNFFVERGVPTRVHHFASWFYFTFHNDARFGSLLYYSMREKGIHIQEGYPCFLTTAHSQADLDAIERAFRETIEEMQRNNVLPSNQSQSSAAVDGEAAPALHPKALRETPDQVQLTEAQQEIYLAAALGDEPNCAFNESVTLRLRGAIREDALRQAIELALARHDALRSTIGDDGESLYIAPAFTGTVEYTDLSSLSPEEREETIQARVVQEGKTPFSLTEGPLVRAALFKLATDEVALIFTAHHIVLDGWSVNQLFEEIGKLYNGGPGSIGKLQPLLPFSSFAIEERTRESAGEFIDNEEYWVKRFTGLAPVLDLPTDRPRPANKTYRGATLKGSLGSSLYANLKKASAKQGCTLYVTLLSGFQLLLHRLTRQQEVVVGISSAGQALFPNASLVGHCVHFLPMLSQLGESMTVKNHLAMTRGLLLDANDHQEFTYGSLLRKLSIPRDSSRLPLIEVQFNLEKVGANINFEGLSSSLKANPKQFVNTDLFLNVMETSTDLEFDCDYNTDLFDKATVERYLRMYVKLLESVVEDASVGVDELGVLGSEERKEIVESWNATEVDWGKFEPIHRMIEQRAAAEPGRVAIEFDGASWTAAELDSYGNRVAQRLRGEGLEEAGLVGICVERSFEMVGAVLGVLKAGGVYVPLDPRHPEQRLEMVVEDSGLKLLVVGKRYGAGQPKLKTTAKVVVLDGSLEKESAAPVATVAGADTLAYVIYTSGSTGRPKGVAIEHGALMNLLRSMEREPGLRKEDVLVAVTTLAFDIAGLELLLPLMTGARLVLATDEQVQDGYELLELLKRSQATVLQATPGSWRMLIDAGWTDEVRLKVLCGGEGLPRDLADKLLDRSPEVWNVYGPTETTIWSSATRVTAGSGPVLIGPPIANTQFYLLDERRQPVPVGVAGELYIGGDGLARGYWKQPELTAEKFVPNPFGAGRIYRTGDLGRWHVEGTGQGLVELLGRTDFQVKIRGFRIELGEIEGALTRHPAVREAIVLAHVSQSNGTPVTRLVAYVDAGSSAQDAAAALTADLIAMLNGTLPPYMIPSVILPLPEMPRTPNGKVDRKALPNADELLKSGSHSDKREFAAPESEEQKKLAEIWADVLNLDRVSITDSIFELGADSLLIFRIASRAKREGLNVTAAQIFQYRTIVGLSTVLAGQQAAGVPAAIKVAPRIAPVPRATLRNTNVKR